MKHVKVACLFNFCIVALFSCADKETGYIDVNTGKEITIVKDSVKGYWINAETKEPLVIYYDVKTKDTLYGKTGEVINNKVMKMADGTYYYEIPKPPVEITIKPKTQDEIDRELLQNGDYKKKVEKDGDVKIKQGDTKIKVDAQTGEKKIKN